MLSIILYNDEISISHYYASFIYPIVKSKNKLFIEIIENIIMYYYKIIEFELYKTLYGIISNTIIKNIINLLTLNKSILILKKFIFYKNYIYVENNKIINLDLILNNNELKILYDNNINIIKLFNDYYDFFKLCYNIYESKFKLFNDVIKYECNHFLNHRINNNWLNYDYSMINYKIYTLINKINNCCNKQNNKQNNKYKRYATYNKSPSYQNLSFINDTIKHSKSFTKL